MGWMFLYAGVTKLFDSSWSAAGYLRGADTLPQVYAWFASPAVLPVINTINEWALTLLGISLILGLFVRLSSMLGVLLMFLYYLPILNFPYVGANNYLVDQHIIFILVLMYLAVVRAGRVWGLDGVSLQRFSWLR